MAWAFVRYSSDYVQEEQVKADRLGVHAHGCGSAWEWRAEHGAWPPRQTGRPPEALTLLDRGRTLLPDSATATAVPCEAYAACEKLPAGWTTDRLICHSQPRSLTVANRKSCGR